MKHESLSAPSGDCWLSLHKMAGISATMIAALLVGEVVVYAVIPSPSSAKECLNLFLESPLFGLLHFDLLGMLSYIFFTPLILSLYRILREYNASVMLVATVLFFVGIAVFFSSNTAFSMLSLSRTYAIAGSEADRAVIVASFQTLLVLFKVQAFMISYILVSTAWFIMGWVMLTSGRFGRFTAWMGMLAGASGVVAEILENVSGIFREAAIACYFAAIVFLIIWVVVLAKQLPRIGANTRAYIDP